MPSRDSIAALSVARPPASGPFPSCPPAPFAPSSSPPWPGSMAIVRIDAGVCVSAPDQAADPRSGSRGRRRSLARWRGGRALRRLPRRRRSPAASTCRAAAFDALNAPNRGPRSTAIVVGVGEPDRLNDALSAVWAGRTAPLVGDVERVGVELDREAIVVLRHGVARARRGVDRQPRRPCAAAVVPDLDARRHARRRRSAAATACADRASRRRRARARG